MKALVLYHTKTGHTLDAARDIVRGLEGEGVECSVQAASEFAVGESDGTSLDEFAIVLFGTPTYGNRRYREPARPVAHVMDSLSPDGLTGKTCGAFTVYAGYGGDRLVGAIETRLAELRGTVVLGGPAVKAGAPLSLWKGPDAGASDVQKCEEFGRRVASFARAKTGG